VSPGWPRVLLAACAALFAASPASARGQQPPSAAVYDVRAHGARGDGETLDTSAIQAAVDAAAAAGGGTVLLPAGTYPSFSIHLRSHVALQLGPGATLLAADPAAYPGQGYDAAEPNPWGDEHRYQDFGHSHWHNSLIWGEHLEDVSILGPGTIDGAGLWKGLHPPLGPAPTGDRPGNKAIALKLCRNVTLSGFTVFRGGHFAILATGVDNLVVDGLRIDTNRDGIDVDACRNVRLSNLSVNSPNDDAIVLKSSFALGEPRATENVTIADSLVSGHALGSLLSGEYLPPAEPAPDRGGPAGRIKLGTESNGGFRNVAISNVVFDRSRGLALESVDGGVLEDVVVSNLVMRRVSNAPFFLRLGARMRGPEGTPVGRLRRVTISNVDVYDADPRYAAVISGIPGHPVEDVMLSDVRIHCRGGLAMAEVGRQPENLVNAFFAGEGAAGRARDPFDVPEREAAYPEPGMFGLLPAYGFYVRHARGLRIENAVLRLIEADERPALVLRDVQGVDLVGPDVDRPVAGPVFVLEDVTRFRLAVSPPLPDVDRAEVAKEAF